MDPRGEGVLTAIGGIRCYMLLIESERGSAVLTAIGGIRCYMLLIESERGSAVLTAIGGIRCYMLLIESERGSAVLTAIGGIRCYMLLIESERGSAVLTAIGGIRCYMLLIESERGSAVLTAIGGIRCYMLLIESERGSAVLTAIGGIRCYMLLIESERGSAVLTAIGGIRCYMLLIESERGSAVLTAIGGIRCYMLLIESERGSAVLTAIGGIRCYMLLIESERGSAVLTAIGGIRCYMLLIESERGSAVLTAIGGIRCYMLLIESERGSAVLTAIGGIRCYMLLIESERGSAVLTAIGGIRCYMLLIESERGSAVLTAIGGIRCYMLLIESERGSAVLTAIGGIRCYMLLIESERGSAVLTAIGGIRCYMLLIEMSVCVYIYIEIYLSFTQNLLSYTTEAGTLEPSQSVRDLGVLVQADLDWEGHIRTIAENGRRKASWVLSVFKTRDRETMITLYKSMVRSLLEYCCPLWSPTKIRDIELLEGVQRSFTRRIAECKGMTYWQRLQYLRISSLQRRRERYIILHMWKMLHGHISNDIGVQFTAGGRLGTRAVVPRIVKNSLAAAQTAYDGSFAVMGPRLWNCLPAQINQITEFQYQWGVAESDTPIGRAVAGERHRSNRNETDLPGIYFINLELPFGVEEAACGIGSGRHTQHNTEVTEVTSEMFYWNFEGGPAARISCLIGDFQDETDLPGIYFITLELPSGVVALVSLDQEAACGIGSGRHTQHNTEVTEVTSEMFYWNFEGGPAARISCLIGDFQAAFRVQTRAALPLSHVTSTPFHTKKYRGRACCRESAM
eukprot:sb/3462218/